MKARQNQDTVVHYNCKCSKCGQSPIKGIRYYCLQCPNFNLCPSCEKAYGERHGHQLLMLRRAEDYEMFKNHFIKETLNKIDDEDKEKTIDLFKCEMNVMNLKKIYTTTNNSNYIPIKVTLKNTGKEQWPSTCYFTCDDNSEVKGKSVKLRSTGKVGEECTINILINLSNVKKTGTYKSIWQLKNENGYPFGQKITFVIQDNFEKDKNLKDFRDDLDEKVKEIKMKYDILFSSASIKNALIKTRGHMNNAVKMLFTEGNKRKK